MHKIVISVNWSRLSQSRMQYQDNDRLCIPVLCCVQNAISGKKGLLQHKEVIGV